jgi:16S rRNA (cytosine1402-N4)-methyltransferase
VDSLVAQQPFSHLTVLRDEVIAALAPTRDGVYADVTLGGGGHTLALLERVGLTARTRVIAIDRDPAARNAARARLGAFGDRVTICDARMSELSAVLAEHGVSGVDGLIADLGVSSPQFDDASRGMSFRSPGPIDMRMDPTQEDTALSLIEQWTDDELANVLYEFGDERASRPIARSIKRMLAAGELNTTEDLARAVYKVLGAPKAWEHRANPATRTFQALRIAVNDELGELERLLSQLASVLNPGAIAAIISFHSLEDRRVKWAFRQDPALQVITKKPIEPSEDEQQQNPRARSAKLRCARRRTDDDSLDRSGDVEDDTEQDQS